MSLTSEICLVNLSKIHCTILIEESYQLSFINPIFAEKKEKEKKKRFINPINNSQKQRLLHLSYIDSIAMLLKIEMQHFFKYSLPMYDTSLCKLRCYVAGKLGFIQGKRN